MRGADRGQHGRFWFSLGAEADASPAGPVGGAARWTQGWVPRPRTILFLLSLSLVVLAIPTAQSARAGSMQFFAASAGVGTTLDLVGSQAGTILNIQYDASTAEGGGILGFGRVEIQVTGDLSIDLAVATASSPVADPTFLPTSWLLTGGSAAGEGIGSVPFGGNPQAIYGFADITISGTFGEVLLVGGAYAPVSTFLATPVTPFTLATVHLDTDGDGIQDTLDNCPIDANPIQNDFDLDGVGDVCDICPTVHDPLQEDTDTDGVGDACAIAALDTDSDGVLDWSDNCPTQSNFSQSDSDQDGLGDACDPVSLSAADLTASILGFIPAFETAASHAETCGRLNRESEAAFDLPGLEGIIEYDRLEPLKAQCVVDALPSIADATFEAVDIPGTLGGGPVPISLIELAKTVLTELWAGVVRLRGRSGARDNPRGIEPVVSVTSQIVGGWLKVFDDPRLELTEEFHVVVLAELDAAVADLVIAAGSTFVTSSTAPDGRPIVTFAEIGSIEEDGEATSVSLSLHGFILPSPAAIPVFSPVIRILLAGLLMLGARRALRRS